MQKITARNIAWASDHVKSGVFDGSHELTAGQRIYLPFKRLMDMLFSAVMLILLIPVFLVVSVLIKRENRKSVIFRQQRVGKNGNLFYIYKFRTMKDDAPDNTASAQLKDAHNHITNIGKFLRNTSIDEMPQFFNVLKGDMTLIGPRPLVPDEAETHIKRLCRGVYGIRPGLTGLAQINGRDLVTPLEKVHYDEKYLKTFGPLTDFGIFLRSISAVLSRRGIAEGDPAVLHVSAQTVSSIRTQQPSQDTAEEEPLYIYENTGSS